MRDRRLGGEAGVRAAQVVAHVGRQLGEAFDVRLVDDGLGPRRVGRRVVLPVEVRIDDDALRDRIDVVFVVHLGVVAAGDVGEDVRRVPEDRPFDRLRIRVDEQLVRVETVPARRVVRPVDAVAVALSRPDAGDVAVPVVRGVVGELDACLGAVLVEQAELDALGVLGEEREVRPFAVPRRSERERPARPDVHLRSSTVLLWKSAMSSTLPRRTSHLARSE